MNWSDHNAGRRRLNNVLLVFLALLAGLLVGAFLERDEGAGREEPAEEDAAGILAGRNDTGVTPSATAEESGISLPTVETPLSPPSPTADAPARATVGAAAPDFTLPDLFDEETTYTLSTYRGRPLILNFWASWCGPCRREMPALQSVADRYAAEGLLVLGIDQTYIDSLADARAFVRELGLSFPSARDDEGYVSSGLYGVVGLPTSVFITPAGDVAHIQIGEMSQEQVEAFAQRLLAGEPLQP